ncbi:SesA protein [Nannizzia gypsea CBS 118893]|uniref:SesA protein n=1 Tax=Arthroderma gypseum (strain ATCC MYA-4604 / CBS 118893) TaxID=535722 RepID=E4UXQ4_ARTGP|nr:SesA protein [Nannizzia gypsea CBS 118893]EFR01949.1 SesA protein [Nannizzia gypsea CBS 118893]
MSGIEAIGLISGIISIVDTAIKLHDALKNADCLPRAFQEVALRLPVVKDTLTTVKGHLEENGGDAATFQAIMPVIEGCSDNAEALKNILQEVMVSPDHSRLQRYRLAIRRLGKGSQVEELMKTLLENVQLLAGNRAIKAATEAQVSEVLEAIHALSDVPPSAPDTPGSVSFAHYGTGSQFNNADGGTQNNNTGSGRQYIAHSMTFGSD